MRAHARIHTERDLTRNGASGTFVRRLRSQGPLVLRPTMEQLPTWASRWGISNNDAATARLVAGAAGPLGGDHLRLDVEVGEGATLMLGAAAATLALPGTHGTASWSEVNISVAEGGTLFWSPGTQIAAENCHHTGFNRIDLAAGARLYAREEVLLGRHGEPPGRFRQRLRISQAGTALYDQELAVGDDAPGWNSAAVTGGRRAVGSVVVVDNSPGNLDCFDTPIPDGCPDTAVMRLAENTVLISSLAADAIDLRARLNTAFSPFTSATA